MNSDSTPLVTVVIATYNRAETLRYAIESVLWQTYKNFELWVIGDCCTDHTEAVVRSFSHDPRVNWYNLPQNSGYQSKPNNEGIRRGKGSHIAYLNHDDIWLPNHLQDTVSHRRGEGRRHLGRPRFPRDRPEQGGDRVTPVRKNIDETFSYPRVDFFRQAQFAGLNFEIVPSLTGLKFLWDEKNYHDVGPQPLYMERLRNEKDYAVKELTGMLIRSEYELFTMPKGKRLSYILLNPLRKMMLAQKIDPASLRFWHKKGTQIRIWRKRHGLKEVTNAPKVKTGVAVKEPVSILNNP